MICLRLILALSVAVAQLSSLIESPGTCMQEFLNGNSVNADDQLVYKGLVLSSFHEQQNSEFESMKDTYLTNLIDCIYTRFFNESSAVLKDFSLIEPMSSCSAADTGNCVEIISNKFGCFIVPDALKVEMTAVVALKNGCYKGHMMQTFAKSLTRHKNELPETSKLCEIALSIPVSTTSCE